VKDFAVYTVLFMKLEFQDLFSTGILEAPAK